MRLIACHVDNFGKLSNVNINFDEGINIINEPNGWGKSTLAAFLKAMLYGFDNKKEPGAFEKERTLYNPWQGGTYGGTLDFQIDDRKYRISRSFGTTEKTDKFQLINLATNLESADYSSNIGEELFDIDRASFKRSIYIAQNDCACGSSDSINAKLGNLAENTDDINNFETAIGMIKSKINKLSPYRITGSIKKRKNEISQLEHEIRGYDAAEISFAEITDKMAEKKAQKVELQGIRQDYVKALKVASEDSRRAELKKTYRIICDELDDMEEEYELIRRQLPSEIPSDELIEEHKEKARLLNEVTFMKETVELSGDDLSRYEELNQKFGEKEPADEMIDEMLSKAGHVTKVKNEHNQLGMKLSQMESMALFSELDEELAQKPKKSGLTAAGVVFLIVAVLVGIVAAAIYVNFKEDLYQLIAFVSGVAAIVILIVGIIMILSGKGRNKKLERDYYRKLEEREQQKLEKEAPIRELRTQLSEISSGISGLERELIDFLDRYQIEYSESTAQSSLFKLQAEVDEYRRYVERIEKAAELQDKCDEIREEIRKFGLGFGIKLDSEIIVELTRIQTKSMEEKISKKALEASQEKRRSFEEQYDVNTVLAAAECPYSIEELNDMIREVDNRIDEIQSSVEHYSRQLEDMQEQLDIRDEKVMELRNCENTQEEETKKFEILNLTSEFLQKSKEQFTARYMAPISEGFQKYYGILTRDDSRNWIVDANISLKMRLEGELRDVKYLSAGYQDLIGVCMRFALADAMYPDEKPFLILDDPFVNLDDEKIAHGKDLLIALEQDYQAIYFTCHESREYR